MDREIRRLVDTVLKYKGTIVITADHGNAEEMIDQKTQEMITEHTKNPVPFIVIRSGVKKQRIAKGGSLIDVAPTLLDLMDIHKPKEMTGVSLIKK